MRGRRATATVLVIAALTWAAPAGAQGLAWVKEHYTKHEYHVPMRDGVRLFTQVYLPKDRSKTYPILMNRTPYGVAPYGVDQYRDAIGPSPLFPKDGYIIVYQDVQWLIDLMPSLSSTSFA